MTKPRALIVTDRKPGHENQSRALCDALGFDCDLVEVRYPNRWMKALSYLADRFGIFTQAFFNLPALSPRSDYHCVIGAGSTAFYPVKVLARSLGVPSVAILYPRGYRLDDFTVILAPAFDRPARRGNLIEIPVNVTPARDAWYREQTEAFLSRYTPAGKKAVAVIVGGPNPAADLAPEWMRRELEALFAATPDCEHWVTTSRRTPEAVDAVIDAFPFDYSLIFSRDPSFNPIPAFVTLCDRVFVTAESTGMVSEAATRGSAAVEVLMNIRRPDSKFGRFVRMLQERGHVHVFDGALGPKTAPVDLNGVFEEIARRLSIKN